MRSFFLTNLVRGDSGAYHWRINLDGISANYADIWGALAPGRTFYGPALLIKGSNSGYIAQPRYEAMKIMFPALRCQTIANAGHWVPTDQPLAFTTALSEFLV
jgi:esterase